MIWRTVAKISSNSWDLGLLYLGPRPWLTKQKRFAPAAAAAFAWARIYSELFSP